MVFVRPTDKRKGGKGGAEDFVDGPVCLLAPFRAVRDAITGGAAISIAGFHAHRASRFGCTAWLFRVGGHDEIAWTRACKRRCLMLLLLRYL